MMKKRKGKIEVQTARDVTERQNREHVQVGTQEVENIKQIKRGK